MPKNRKHPCIIRSIRYNQEKDPKNLYREKMMLYLPYRGTEKVLQGGFDTRYEAYLSCQILIDPIEHLFCSIARTKWGDIDIASETIASKDRHIFSFDDLPKQQYQSIALEQCDIEHDLIQRMMYKKNDMGSTDTICSVKQPFVLSTNDYYDIRKKLNKEQQSIIKEIIMWKKNNPTTPFHLILTGGAGTRKCLQQKQFTMVYCNFTTTTFIVTL